MVVVEDDEDDELDEEEEDDEEVDPVVPKIVTAESVVSVLMPPVQTVTGSGSVLPEFTNWKPIATSPGASCAPGTTVRE